MGAQKSKTFFFFFTKIQNRKTIDMEANERLKNIMKKKNIENMVKKKYDKKSEEKR